jgi:hypothetical protein
MVSTPATAGSIPSPFSRVAGHVRDAVPGLVAVPAEHPYVAARFPQARDDLTPERTGCRR